jgi:hypothetical protein
LKKPELSCLPKTKIACHQRFARRTRCGLATEIFPLAQNENSKKERTTYRKVSNEVLRAVGGQAKLF